MSNTDIRGRFVWHELMTTDPQAAVAFYSRVLPWKSQASDTPEYTLWVSGNTMAGGLMAQPESARGAGAPPSWLVYIGTPDVDATAAAAQRLGGEVLKAPDDIPHVGRFAVLADPQGAAFAVFTPSSMPPGTAPASDFSWHELATSDQQGALAFYSELFGWKRGRAHDMGPAGSYQLIEHDGAEVGGVYRMMDASKAPHWLTYIRVASVDRAADAVREAGGQVTQGPMEVPGGSRIAQVLDPQGGAFAVHEPAARQTVAAGTAAARSTGRRATARRPTAAGKSPAKRRAAARKSPATRAPARKKAPARPAKRTAAKAKKRPGASRRVARKAPARKAPARKAPARKAASKRAAARRPAAKKPARRRPARAPTRRR